jgi:hypothetical protein
VVAGDNRHSGPVAFQQPIRQLRDEGDRNPILICDLRRVLNRFEADALHEVSAYHDGIGLCDRRRLSCNPVAVRHERGKELVVADRVVVSAVQI